MKRQRNPQARGRSGRVQIEFATMRADLKAHGLTSASLPAVLLGHLGTQTSRQSVARWFTHGTMTLQQYAELTVVARLEKGVTVSFWRYVKRDRHKR